MAVSSLFVSVVCRLQDDAAIVEPLVEEIARILKAQYENWELVLVDDGSIDGTPQRVKQLLHRVECVRLLRLSRRFGIDIALTAGLETAIGDVVVTMSGDSDPPALIPQLVEHAQRDSAVVYGVDPRRTGQGVLRRVGARLFYWSCRQLFDLPVVPHSTHFRALTRQAVNAIVEIKDKYRYLRALTPYIGFPTKEVEYQRMFRHGAPRREPLLSSVETALSVIVGNSTRPLRYVTWLGLFAAALNLAYIGYVFAIHLFKSHVAEGWVTLSLQNAGMFLLLFLLLSVVNEYVGRILAETRDRPLYYIAEEANSSVLVADRDRRNVVAESR